MQRDHDEERLGVLLRLLRPPPPAGCRPRRSCRALAARRDRHRRASRGGSCLPRRVDRRLEQALAAEATSRTGASSRAPRTPARELTGRDSYDSGVVESVPCRTVTAHKWDASRAALPAWSLAKDAVDQIALPGTGRSVSPATGRSAAPPERACASAPDSGSRQPHPAVGELETPSSSRSARTTKSSPTRILTANVSAMERLARESSAGSRPRRGSRACAPRRELHRLGRSAAGRSALRDRGRVRV